MPVLGPPLPMPTLGVMLLTALGLLLPVTGPDWLVLFTAIAGLLLLLAPDVPALTPSLLVRPA